MPMSHGEGSAWPSLASWHLTGTLVAAIAVGGLILALSWRVLRPSQRSFFAAGCACTALLLASDIQARSMSSYRCHMIEHIAVVLVIAPVFAAGVRRALSRSSATVAFLAFTVVVPVYHLTRLGGYVMDHPDGHLVELLSFLVIGVWFWTPVYGAGRVMSDRQRILYVALATPVIATTGLVLWSSTSASLHDINMNMSMIDLGDVHNGGMVMMVLGTLLMLAHLAGLSLASARRELVTHQPVGRRYA
jgi:cytochrome c oxidase assembly factor CtaG